MLELLKVSDKETYHRVCEAAMADGHFAIAPSHFWTDRNGKISGYFSDGQLPVCHFWSRSDSTPRRSVEAILTCKEVARSSNPSIGELRLAMIACAENSPFYPHMERFHFKPITKTVLFLSKV